ncbi:MAG: hypothetical protein H0U57_02085 [Tatlockia sp.]|nr:hypothetical protein [Tatlockia sp.]
MFELLRELARNLGIALLALVSALTRAGITSYYFIRDTFRAHYNLLGQFTAPIETELLGTAPPSLSSLNIFGQIALTLLPLTVLAWIISLTVAPLLYNSIRFIKSSVVGAFSLIFLDLPEYEQIGLSQEDIAELKQRPWYRYVYGLPGILLGAGIGLVAAGVFGLLRVIANSFESFKPGFAFITNLALDNEDSIEDDDERPWQKRYLFGFPGLVLGAIFGICFGFPIVALVRILGNSFKNILSLRIAGLNLIPDEERPIDGGFKFDLKPSFSRKYILGFPGLILGSLIALIAITRKIAQKIIVESWKTASQFTRDIVEQALPAEENLEQMQSSHSEVNSRSYVQRFFWGAPGVLLGLIGGVIGYSAVMLGRVLISSYLSALSSFVVVANFSLHPEDKIKEQPFNKEAKSFGLPGFIFGGTAGILAFLAIGFTRIVFNSFKTTKRFTNSAVNLVIHENEQFEDILTNDERSLQQKLLGAFGYILGLLTAALGIAIAGVRRIIIESWKSTQSAFKAIAEEARSLTEDEYLIESEPTQMDQELIIESEKRSILDQYILGSPGLVLGILAGSVRYAGTLLAQVGEQSYTSAKRSFLSITNFGLHPSHHISEEHLANDFRLSKQIYGFGFPGIILGGLAGIFGFLIMGFGRNSYETAKRLRASSLNAVRTEQIEENLETDQRGGVFQYALGFPGLVIGSFISLGAIAIVALDRSRIESWLTTKEFFNSITSQVLPVDYKAPEHSFFDKNRTNFTRYVIGGPGVILGLLSGSIAFAGIALVRIAVNSVKSTWNSFVSVSMLAVDFKYESDYGLSKDSRENPLKYGFGFIGIVLGGAGGIFGFVGIGLGRILVNSAKNVKSLTIKGWNFVQDDEEEIDRVEIEEEWSFFAKNILGFPGLVIGLFTAAFAIAFSALQRSAIESLKTAKIIYSNIANAAREEEFSVVNESDFDLSLNVESGSEGDFSAEELFESEESVVKSPGIESKKRSKLNHYFFGAPGYLIGGIAGIAGFAGIIIKRIFKESLRTTVFSFVTVINLALDSNDIYTLEANRRPLKYGFGFPGLFLGSLSGSLAFLAISLGRIITNSFESMRRLSASTINLVRLEQVNDSLNNDERSRFRVFGLGAPGVVIGLLMGSIGFLIATLERVAIESFKIATQLFITMTAKAFPESGEQRFREFMTSVSPNPPGPYGQIFGLPGYLLGVIAGGFGFAVVGFSRVVSESINFVLVGLGRIINESKNTGTRMFTSVANLGLDPENNEQFFYPQLETNDGRSWPAKYLLGLPGALLGAILGGITLAGIVVVKIATQSFESWRALSGSLLNGSLRMPLFSGLGGDVRSTHQKIMGSLGYLLTLVTTLPISALIFSFKTAIPALLGLVLGALSSPFIATIKGFLLASNPPRFEENVELSANLTEQEQLAKSTEQRFKNLYSSATVWGQLAENTEIKENQNGRKGPESFARKAFTFNLSSLHENLLDSLLAAYRKSADKEHFFDDNGEYLAILENVEEYYSELSCLEPRQAIEDREEQIKVLGEFIKDYIKGKTNRVPEHLYSNPKKSWSAIFWGSSLNQNSSPVNELNDPVMGI